MQTRKYRVEKRRDLQLSRASHLRLSPKALCTKENDCPPIGHDSWLGWAKPPKREVKAEVLSVVLQLCDNDHENIRAEAVHLQKWKRFTKGSDPSAPLDHSVPTVWLQNSKPRFVSACLAPASQSKADPRADSKVVPLVSGETATVVEVDADAMALNKRDKSAMLPWWSSQPKKHGKGKGKACHSEGSSEQSLSIAHTMGPRKEGPTRAAYLGLTPGARSILGSKGILRNRCT